MRRAITPVILTAVLITVVLFSGCAITGSGDVITEKEDFADFTYVDVGSVFEVEITRSDSFGVVISVDKSLLDYVDVSKVGGTLRISLQPHQVFTDFNLKAKTLKAKITMPALRGLSLAGKTKASINGFKSPNDFSLDISGASSLDMGDIEAGNAGFAISGTSKVTGDMKASHVKFEVSGASQVELAGSANTTVLNASGASKINLTDFLLNYASINLSGASEATLNPKDKLDAVLMDASTLYFLGNPTIGNINVSGASTVKHK